MPSGREKRLAKQMAEAIDAGAVDKIDSLFKKGCPRTNGDGQPWIWHAFHASGKEERIASLKNLLKHGFSPDEPDRSGRRLLHQSLRYGSRSHLTNILLEAGADVNTKDIYDDIFFDVVVSTSAWEFLQKSITDQTFQGTSNVLTSILIKDEIKGEDFNYINSFSEFDINAGDAPPLIAALYRRRNIFENILAQEKTDVDVVISSQGKQWEGYKGYTALHMAAKQGQAPAAKALISKGAEVRKLNEYGKTALEIAIENGYFEVAHILVEAMKENPKAGDELIFSRALCLSAKGEKVRLSQILVEAGASANFRNEEGKTPVICAVDSVQESQIRFLLSKGADPDVCDDKGLSARDYCGFKGRERFLPLFNAKEKKSELVVNATDGAYTKLSDQAIELREGSLSTVFNFQTQQVIYKYDTGMTAQNFSDVEGRSAIAQAYDKLVELKGTPAAPAFMPAKKREMISKL